jgi:hypothetical protein
MSQATGCIPQILDKKRLDGESWTLPLYRTGLASQEGGINGR